MSSMTACLQAHDVRESAEATVDSVKHRAEDVLNAAARGAEVGGSSKLVAIFKDLCVQLVDA
jgi:hypothetical protein